MKIDFVNDVQAHFGEIQKTDVYYQTDSIRNILSNKYSALYRVPAKDIVDICEIAKNYSFNWDEIIKEADQKNAGIDVVEVVNIFQSVPDSFLKNIKWKKKLQS